MMTHVLPAIYDVSVYNASYKEALTMNFKFISEKFSILSFIRSGRDTSILGNPAICFWAWPNPVSEIDSQSQSTDIRRY